MQCSGLAKRARYVMSHRTGKIEVLRLDAARICFKYHQAAEGESVGMFLIRMRNPEAGWFDDHTSVVSVAAIPQEEPLVKAPIPPGCADV